MREFFANENDASALVSRAEFLDFWNSLTYAEKKYYLHTDLPKRVYSRSTSSDVVS